METTLVSGWITFVLLAEFAVILFAYAMSKAWPWHRRGLFAFAAVQLAFVALLLLSRLLSGSLDRIPLLGPMQMLGGFLLAHVLIYWIFKERLLANFSRGGCLSVIGRIVGCGILAWLTLAGLLLLIALAFWAFGIIS